MSHISPRLASLWALVVLAGCSAGRSPEPSATPASQQSPAAPSASAGAAPATLAAGSESAESIFGAWMMMTPTKGEEREGGPLKITDDEFLVVRERSDGSRGLIANMVTSRERGPKSLVMHIDNSGREIVCSIASAGRGTFTAQCTRSVARGVETQDYALERISDARRVKELDALVEANAAEPGACAKLEPCCKVALQAKSKSAACDFVQELKSNNGRECTNELRAMRELAQQNGKSVPKQCQ